ncbi:hypothetical protein [Planctobacterium marinum]|uniref:Uncharacterized protein n=1 Tax=Planctobacterium marinum TaxID=1631968 RepID=A0AA48HUM7_9ALTE|nr:hypothetical protein MACH26_04210 [Planctobacterium marinum]
MSESQKDFESRLQQQYQRQKQSAQPPESIKRYVLAKARRADKSPGSGLQKLPMLALAASLLVLAWLVLLPERQLKQETQFTVIDYHGLEAESSGSVDSAPAIQRRFEYNAAQQRYAYQSQLGNAERKVARLSIQLDGSWQLATCEQNALLISKELVALLQKQQRLPAVLQPEAPMEVLFANDGKILQINQTEAPLLCD